MMLSLLGVNQDMADVSGLAFPDWLPGSPPVNSTETAWAARSGAGRLIEPREQHKVLAKERGITSR
jgi:hypothetical protein